MNIQRLLNDRLTTTIRTLYPDISDAPPIVMQTKHERFGDYQVNIMKLAKRLKRNPKDVATKIIAAMDITE